MPRADELDDQWIDIDDFSQEIKKEFNNRVDKFCEQYDKIAEKDSDYPRRMDKLDWLEYFENW